MKVYLRNKNKKMWHWELECPEYPEGRDVIRLYKRPSKGEFCSLCKQIEAQGKSKTHKREMLGDDNFF